MAQADWTMQGGLATEDAVLGWLQGRAPENAHVLWWDNNTFAVCFNANVPKDNDTYEWDHAAPSNGTELAHLLGGLQFPGNARVMHGPYGDPGAIRVFFLKSDQPAA